MSEQPKQQEVNSTESTITVLGLGHIGLPTALGLADLGWNVIGADDDAKKVGLIRSGDPIFFEPGLLELLTKHLKAASLSPSMMWTPPYAQVPSSLSAWVRPKGQRPG